MLQHIFYSQNCHFGLRLVRDIRISGERKKCLRKGKKKTKTVLNGGNTTLNIYSEVYSILHTKQCTSNAFQWELCSSSHLQKPKSSCSWLSLLPLSHSYYSNHTKVIAISLPLDTHLASVMFFWFLFSITSSKRSFLIIFYKITHPHLITVYTLFISLFFVSLSLLEFIKPWHSTGFFYFYLLMVYWKIHTDKSYLFLYFSLPSNCSVARTMLGTQ